METELEMEKEVVVVVEMYNPVNGEKEVEVTPH